MAPEYTVSTEEDEPRFLFLFSHRDEGYNSSRSYKYNKDRKDLEAGQLSDCHWAGGRMLKANTNLSFY